MTNLGEECAELIVALSKIKRFGVEANLNRRKLIQETADVLLMIDLLKEEFEITENEINMGKSSKEEKLKVYSSIYSNEDK